MSSTSKPPYFQEVLDALENFRYESTNEEKKQLAQALDSYDFINVNFGYELAGNGGML